MIRRSIELLVVETGVSFHHPQVPGFEIIRNKLRAAAVGSHKQSTEGIRGGSNSFKVGHHSKSFEIPV